MAPKDDVAWVASELQGVLKLINIEDYSHMDFVWGSNSAPMLYNIMKNYIHM